MRLMAIDPGPTESAWVRLEDGRLLGFGKVTNDAVTSLYRSRDREWLAIEMIASYGMPVGAEVFETCVAIGRFIESWTPGSWTLVYRKDVKLHLCNSPRANDAAIRQALIDRYGGRDKAIGKKANPGPLYGVSGDVWSALAVAVTWSETRAGKEAV
jgi:hypothetical protein